MYNFYCFIFSLLLRHCAYQMNEWSMVVIGPFVTKPIINSYHYCKLVKVQMFVFCVTTDVYLFLRSHANLNVWCRFTQCQSSLLGQIR